MFAYCNNNPILFSDPTGTRLNGPSYVIVNDGGSSCSNLRKPVPTPRSDISPKDDNAWDKVQNVATSFYNNLDCSAGIGQGLYFEFDLLDVIGAGIGFYGNYLSIHLNNGEISFGQEVYGGATATLIQEFGICGYEFMQNGETVEESSWAWINSEQESISIVGASCYLLFAGFSFDIRFNFGGFFKELDEIF